MVKRDAGGQEDAEFLLLAGEGEPSKAFKPDVAGAFFLDFDLISDVLLGVGPIAVGIRTEERKEALFRPALEAFVSPSRTHGPDPAR